MKIKKFYLIFLVIIIYLISSISQIGDLIISYFKRKCKIKNTGNILPGHGGLLDRIDGMIFVFHFIFLILLFFKMNEKKIAILGSTGSIGKQTLEIIKKDKKKF